MNPEIRWLSQKTPNWFNIHGLIQQCVQTNQYTNQGVIIPQLEDVIRQKFGIESHKAVIVTNNGTSALHALVAGLNLSHGRELVFATQAFTFPSSNQGTLSHSVIVDIDSGGGADLAQVDVSKVDGLVVTNVHGNVVDLRKYTLWADTNQKILLLDNAATGYTFYGGKNSCHYGTGAIISFHHTKPFGFAEGGCIIVDHQYEYHIRRALNFGIDNNLGDLAKYSSWCSNWRMSDLNASFILSYLHDHFDRIVSRHKGIYEIFREKCPLNYKLFPNYSDQTPVCASICLLRIDGYPVVTSDLPFVTRKYYRPLEVGHPESDRMYQQIICLPCNIDLSNEQINYMIEEINVYPSI